MIRPFRRRFRRAPSVALVAIALAATGPLLAAGSAQAAPASTRNAFVRAAHFSPDTGNVDVYLTAFSGGTTKLWLSGVGYGDVSTFRSIPAGDYAVSMRAHGAAANTAPALTWTIDAQAGDAYTAAAVGKSTQLRGIVLPDTLSPPKPGTGLVRVIQASSQAGHLGVTTSSGSVLTTDTPYGSASPFVAVRAGTWTVNAKSTTDPGLTGLAHLSVASAGITSVVVLDARGGGLLLRTVVDAAGPGLVPTGSIDARGRRYGRPSGLDDRRCSQLARSRSGRSRPGGGSGHPPPARGRAGLAERHVRTTPSPTFGCAIHSRSRRGVVSARPRCGVLPGAS